MRPFTDREFDKLPMIFLVDDSKPWDPSVLNSTSSSEEYWLNSHPKPTNNNSNFPMTRDYLPCTVLLSDVSWTFDAWGDNPAKLGNQEVIVFEHPPPDVDEAIELQIEQPCRRRCRLRVGPQKSLRTSMFDTNNDRSRLCNQEGSMCIFVWVWTTGQVACVCSYHLCAE